MPGPTVSELGAGCLLQRGKRVGKAGGSWDTDGVDSVTTRRYQGDSLPFKHQNSVVDEVRVRHLCKSAEPGTVLFVEGEDEVLAFFRAMDIINCRVTAAVNPFQAEPGGAGVIGAPEDGLIAAHAVVRI